MTDDLNEEAMIQAIIKVKKHTEPLKLFIRPTWMLVDKSDLNEAERAEINRLWGEGTIPGDGIDLIKGDDGS